MAGDVTVTTAQAELTRLTTLRKYVTKAIKNFAKQQDSSFQVGIYDDKGRDVGELYKTYGRGRIVTGSGSYQIGLPNNIWRFTELDLTKLAEGLDSGISVQSKVVDTAKKVQAASDLANPYLGPINKTGELIYNVSGVKDIYFSPGKQVQSIVSTTLMSADGDFPTKVSQAVELWSSSVNHKGMITTWTPPAGVKFDVNKTSGLSNIGGGGTTNYGLSDPNKYAFQFLYNPQPITMGYKGAPAIDVTQYTSGSEDYALWAGGEGGGTISFELLLNRMLDMKYYTKGILNTSSNPYIGRKPLSSTNAGTLFDEQEAIYNGGTMYDLEFLLRTVMGVTINSSLRGNTADIGWVGAKPIEVHLGPRLRYWGTLSGLTVNHVIFNERMVPIFSTIRVEISRLPDFNWSASSGTGATLDNYNALSAAQRTQALRDAYSGSLGVGGN